MIRPISIIDAPSTPLIALSAQHEGQLRFHQKAQITANGLLNVKPHDFKNLSRNLDNVLDKLSNFWYVDTQFNHGAFSFLGFLGQPKSKRECAFFLPENRIYTKDITLPLIEQLQEGGRLISPVVEHGIQNLVLFEKGEEDLKKAVICQVLYVPFKGMYGAN